MSQDTKSPPSAPTPTAEPIELPEDNLGQIAGGQTKVVGSSSNIKNNLTAEQGKIAGGSSEIKTK